MAQTLRRTLSHQLSWLALLLVGLVYVPLLPGLVWALGPSLDAQVWQGLASDPQFVQAVQATLVSSLLGTLLACLMAAGLATRLYPGAAWQRLQQRLPLLLSIPHAAFAIGLFFLIAPSGWLARAAGYFLSWASPPGWVTVQDPYGLSLALALAFKESWFLLWVLAAVLGEQALKRQMAVARSLGYSAAQTWRLVLWPQVLPRLGWPVAAALAYSLSVVDMAVILGPGTPPTLAVLTWHWLSDPDAMVQAQGGAASLVLLALFPAVAALAFGSWRVLMHQRAYPSGRRLPAGRQPWPWQVPLLGVGYAALGVLAVWSVAQSWFFPALWPEALTRANWRNADWAPFWTTLWLALAVSLLCLPVVLIWLEWGPKRLNALLYVPLIVPALPLVAAQYAALLHLRLDASPLALVWSHLLWVLPYMLLTLVGAYRAFDARLMTCARALGNSQLQACLRVKWPLLLRPLLAAWAVGFAVSVAQYLPSLFAGGGRFATVTTEAVALSAGGSRQVLAVQALLQVVLPLAAFALAFALVRFLSRHRLGLR
ncbi:ABC transporter permease [Rhodoferax sp. 4810]|nr:ABC transporter permease [Rhodoferax jenense]